jgi:nicotinamidase-related amidase
MLHNASESTLILVDIQQRLMPAIFAGDRVLMEATRLARIARLLNVPVIGTEQNPDGLGEDAADIKQLCDQTLIKHHFDGCADHLVEALSPDRRTAIVAGCEAHVCVLQTALGLLDRGLAVTVVVDAIGARTERSRDTAVQRLSSAGATMATVEMIAFEWMKTSNHPKFRDVLALVR